MSKIPESSLAWLDQLEALESFKKQGVKTQVNLAKALGLSQPMVSQLSKLAACLDEPALQKVRQAAQANPPFILSFRNAQELERLKAKTVDDASFQAALDLVLAKRLSSVQIWALAQWLGQGQPLSEFNTVFIFHREK